MNLDDFLKPQKVRCINHSDLTAGKHYDVVGATYGLLKIHNDNGVNIWYDMNCFELVIEPVVNQLQEMKLTPELEAEKPKFKVGDKVYIPNIKNLCTIRNDGKVITSNGQYYCDLSDSYDLCFVLATPENHAILSKLYPHIEFEQPPKELTGSDLCFEKLRSGKKLVICAVSDLSDEEAIKRLEYSDGCIRIIKDCDPTLYHFIDTHGIRHGFAVPLNDETGEPLTASILND